jgi:hypothetical protein
MPRDGGGGYQWLPCIRCRAKQIGIDYEKAPTATDLSAEHCALVARRLRILVNDLAFDDYDRAEAHCSSPLPKRRPVLNWRPVWSARLLRANR